MFGWIFLLQNVRVVNVTSLLPMIISFNVSRSSRNSYLNLAYVTPNFSLGLRQFEFTAAQSLRLLQNILLRIFFADYMLFQHNSSKLLLE